MFNAISEYIQGANEELRHVRWPTRQQAVRLSFIVLGFTAVCTVFFGTVDFVLAQLIRFLISFTY